MFGLHWLLGPLNEKIIAVGTRRVIVPCDHGSALCMRPAVEG